MGHQWFEVNQTFLHQCYGLRIGLLVPELELDVDLPVRDMREGVLLEGLASDTNDEDRAAKPGGLGGSQRKRKHACTDRLT